jgi:hypothetical protein
MSGNPGSKIAPVIAGNTIWKPRSVESQICSFPRRNVHSVFGVFVE